MVVDRRLNIRTFMRIHLLAETIFRKIYHFNMSKKYNIYWVGEIDSTRSTGKFEVYAKNLHLANKYAVEFLNTYVGINYSIIDIMYSR